MVNEGLGVSFSAIWLTLEASVFLYTAAMQAEDFGGPAPSPLTLAVTQISPRFGPGRTASATVSI